ncbi:calcium-binding protein 7 [Ursus maritimus]|uniref:Calcium-binding protein 7 n=1 Tax=Ursus maritimus TaxID=29073 RepID=A0A8M1EX68_URSMA|nr:calcium-binding protein 7 [Ursus maritimus]
MPFHPVTAALMYRGIYTVPNLLSEQRPVDIPEDELEGECPAGTPARRPSYLCAQVKRGLGAQGAGGRPQVPAASPFSTALRGPPAQSAGRAAQEVVATTSGQIGRLEIREAFKVFDRDGNGFISKQELGTAMRSLGYMPNEVELEVIIQRLDMDGDGQVDFEEFVTLLGPKLSTSGIPEKFHGTDFDTVFWKCDMQKLTVDELKRLLYDTFCEHLSMKDIENIIMTEEESHLGTAEECPVDVETCSNQQIRQTCVRKSLICAFAIAFIISVMLIAANQVLRSGMK